MSGDLSDRLRQMADDLHERAAWLRESTHSDACWQWHDACALVKAADERKSFLRWKAEATEVIENWERVYEALGDVGGLGQRRSDAALSEVLRMKAAEGAQADEWVECTCGDPGYAPCTLHDAMGGMDEVRP